MTASPDQRRWVLACLLWWGCAPMCAAVWRVQPGQDLHAAINQAAAGDVVEVERGFYDQNLRIEKPMTLRGINRPTLSGGQRGDTIRVTAPEVVTEGLIVRDSGTELVHQHDGIYLQPGEHQEVARNCVLVYNLFGFWIDRRRPLICIKRR